MNPTQPQLAPAPIAQAPAPISSPTPPSIPNRLTPQLNDQQLRQNIDAMTKQGISRPSIQNYVNNYSKGSDGNYVLKTPAPYDYHNLLSTPSTSDGPISPASVSNGNPNDLSIKSVASRVGGNFENMAQDATNLVRGMTVGTVKNLAAIPGAAAGLVKEQGLPGAIATYEKSAAPSTIKALWSFVPQSAKDIINTGDISKIPTEVQTLAKDSGGYVNALKSIAQAIPHSIPASVGQFINQVNQGGADIQNHPLNEAIGYSILASLLSPKATAHEEPSMQDAQNAKAQSATETTPVETQTGTPQESSSLADTVNSVKEKIAPSKSLDQVVGQILQAKGNARAIRAGISTLTDTEPVLDEQGNLVSGAPDMSNVKSYQEGSDILKNQVDNIKSIQDARLAQYTDTYNLNDLEQTVGSGKNAVTTNYAKQAIAQLQELYTKTNDAEGLSSINALADKAKTDGLTVQEVNQLARDYGSEFGIKAFSKTVSHDPLTSVNAQQFENTRTGLKETARDLMPDDVSKALDKQISDTLTTKDYFDKMDKAVTSLTERLQAKNVFQKVMGAVGKFGKVTGVGDLVSKLLGMDKLPGTSTMNAVEIQDALTKNLGQIDTLMGKSDPGFIAGIKNMIQSNFDAIKNTPNKQGGFINLGGLDMTDEAAPNNSDFTARPKEVVSGLDQVPKHADVSPAKPSNIPDFPSTEINPDEVQLKNAEILNKGRAYSGSIERASEQSGGWQPGMKQMFDTALNSGDKMAVKALIRADAIPVQYKELFATEIANVLKK